MLPRSCRSTEVNCETSWRSTNGEPFTGSPSTSTWTVTLTPTGGAATAPPAYFSRTRPAIANGTAAVQSKDWRCGSIAAAGGYTAWTTALVIADPRTGHSTTAIFVRMPTATGTASSTTLLPALIGDIRYDIGEILERYRRCSTVPTRRNHPLRNPHWWGRTAAMTPYRIHRTPAYRASNTHGFAAATAASVSGPITPSMTTVPSAVWSSRAALSTPMFTAVSK